MSVAKTIPRPGGRSARVQAAVHAATSALVAELGRAALTVPLIAARAGVTPSTIYRRWGDLGELLADVAVERLRPDGEPADTGSVASDLLAWAEQYADEMSSEVGLAMMRDVVAAAGASLPVVCPCVEFTSSQIAAIVERGAARGEAVPQVEAVMDTVVSPIVYRALFGPAIVSRERVRGLVEACLKTAVKKRRAAAA